MLCVCKQLTGRNCLALANEYERNVVWIKIQFDSQVFHRFFKSVDEVSVFYPILYYLFCYQTSVRAQGGLNFH